MTDPAAPQVSRGLLIALGVVAGLAVLFGLYTFVISPLLDGDDVADPPATDPTDPDGEPGDEVDGDDPVVGDLPEDDEDGTAPLPETFEVFTARDPFQQLVVRPIDTEGTTDGTTDGTTSDGTTQPGTTQPGTTQPGTTQPGTTQPGTTQPGTTQPGTTQPGTTQPGTTQPGASPSPAPPGTTVGTTTVRLVDVSTGEDGELQISVSVNGEGFEVGVGETFRDSFRVLDISGSCATLLFGDSRFTLCTGEEIRK